ncbi:MAG: hypothetical protein K2O62_03855, partial [Clostridia bacterium]|nr:hypothetical protein [Clostridia bacterium]
VLPFNLMRCIIAVVVTLPVYKHISRLINKLNDKLTPPKPDGEDGAGARKLDKRTLITIIVVAVVCVLLVAGVLLRYFLTAK